MQIYTEKEVLLDGLSAQKACTALFNQASNECVHDNVRQAVLNILDEEHEIQVEVLRMGHGKVYYETPSAEEKKVCAAKEKFAQSV